MAHRFFRSISVLAVVLSAAFLAVPAYAQHIPVEQINDDNMLLKPSFASDPKGAIEKARQFIAAGEMKSAIRFLELYVDGHPAEIVPRRFLGDLYFRTGDLARATEEYKVIVGAMPSDKETHNRLGTVYAVENRVDEAIAQFNAALPGTDSVDDLVRLHQRKGDLAQYRSQMERIARDNPTDADLQAELGQVYNAVHQPYAASIYFKRALDSDSGNLTARNGLGLAELDMHDYASAEMQFRACLVSDPTAYQCEENLAAAQLEARNLDAAQASLDRAYKLAPERAETLVNYGYLADIRGDWQKAVSFYARAIEMYPYLQESYIDLALAYEEHKLYPLAQAALLKGLASVPDDGRLHFLLGKAYEAQGKRNDAIAQYKLAAKGTDPDASRIARAFFTEPSGIAPLPEKT